MKKENLPKGGRIYFQSSNNKEVKELELMLGSMKPEAQKDAMKQIIASMTIGKDVSSLFSYVINCMRTKSVELKKLIYLYIINYAKVKPDLTILGVAAFSSDARDERSPLIRGLAVRTMGCIRVNTIVSYLCEILTKCLKDNDAYVRKIAALCVAKLYITNPNQVKEHGFINILLEMLQDPNAIVIANALSALNEISVLSGENLIKIKSKVLKKVILALPEANEWSQVCILDALTLYKPKKSRVEEIIEGVLPRLSHANASVVMSAMKVILKLMDEVENFDKIKSYSKKLSNSLVSLMIAGPEIQYVLLRSLHAIIQKRPMLLDKDFKFFFIKYNDPIYVKIEKMEILYKLTDNSNFELILKEFKSYALCEIDQDLIQKAIKYLGYIGIKFEKSLDLCVDFLKEILDNDNEGALNEAIVIARDLIRKYKGRTLEIIKKINFDLINSLTTSEAKSAVIFLIGEFCTIIPKSTELLSSFLETFSSETTPSNVKLQILNSAVKNYVNKPDEPSDLVQICLKKGAEESENPDDRDRAYIYWRLLEIDADMAKEMITAPKPQYDFNEDILFEADVIDDMVENMTNVSSVYHVTSREIIQPEDMITETEEGENAKDKPKDQDNNGKEEKGSNKKDEKHKKPKKKEKKEKEHILPNPDADLLGLEDEGQTPTNQYNQPQNVEGNTMNQLMDIFGNTSQIQQPSVPDKGENMFMDPFKTGFNAFDESKIQIAIFNNQSGTRPSKIVNVFSSDKYSIYSSSHRDNGIKQIGLFIINKTAQNAQVNIINIKPNSFGLAINSAIDDIMSQSGKAIILSLNIDDANRATIPPSSPFYLDCALTISNEQFDIKISLTIHCLFIENWKFVGPPFGNFFNEHNGKQWNSNYFSYSNKINENNLKKLFESNNIMLSARKPKATPPLIYFSGNILEKIIFLIEVENSQNGLKVRVISQMECIVPLVKECLDDILN